MNGSDIVGIGVVVAALGLALFVASGLRRRELLSAEESRKLVHIAMGCIALALPELFATSAPVIALAAGAAIALLAVRHVPALRRTLGPALHGVGRNSAGEFAFVAGIALLFVLVRGDALVYTIPVAVLTVADPMAALIGTRWGRHRLAMPGGAKSVEGSAAFFVTAFACIAAPLAFAGSPAPIAAALVVACALTLLELCSPYGLDNIVLPLAGAVLVRAATAGTFAWSCS